MDRHINILYSMCSSPVLLDLPLPLAVPLLSVLLLYPLQLHSLLLVALPLLCRLLLLLLLPQLLFALERNKKKHGKTTHESAEMPKVMSSDVLFDPSKDIQVTDTVKQRKAAKS